MSLTESCAHKTDVNNFLVGKRVIVYATGTNCVKEYHGCIGTVTSTYTGHICVDTENGPSAGYNVGFVIGARGFSYEFIEMDWDK